jgi:hypothetical protein
VTVRIGFRAAGKEYAGGFTTNNLCDGSGSTEHANVGTAVPSDSPDGGYSHRKIADPDCAAEVAASGQISRSTAS